MAHGSGHGPLDHVMDNTTLELPGLSPIPLPFGLTRFMLMELIAAGLILAIFIPLAQHIARNPVTRGRWFNALEGLVLFVRDKIVAQGMHGKGEIRRFSPFFLSLFFFLLVNNLLGQVPGGATPTSNLNVTGVFALTIFGIVLISGIAASGGPVRFLIDLVPNLDLPPLLKGPIWLLMFFVEILSLFIRHIVLALRLFANMFAGHAVQAVVLGFILTAGSWTWLVAPVSIVSSTALMALELFVAALQAYVFCLLSSLFIGTALHPHH
jgi:F-type H+-transporting ATPase subunit a